MASKQAYVRQNMQHQAVVRLTTWWWYSTWGAKKSTQWERMSTWLARPDRSYCADNLLRLQRGCIADPRVAESVLDTLR